MSVWKCELIGPFLKIPHDSSNYWIRHAALPSSQSQMRLRRRFLLQCKPRVSQKLCAYPYHISVYRRTRISDSNFLRSKGTL